MQLWSPECVVSVELAKQLIESQFPDLAPARVLLLGEGWDNTAYVVNQQYVFRFPRRQISVDLIELETRILGQIASRLPLPIPVPIYVGVPTSDYVWPFAGYKMLSGLTACRANLNRDERCRAAKPLAEFLRALHAISDLDVPGDKIRRLDIDFRRPKTLDNLQKIEQLALFADTASLFKLLDSFDGLQNLNTRSSICHGDLYARHLLVDEQRQLCGVIDWGDVHCGNPAMDLAEVYAFFPPEGCTEFFQTYGAIDENMVQVAKFRALFSTSVFMLFAYDIGDRDLLREAKISFKFLSCQYCLNM